MFRFVRKALPAVYQRLKWGVARERDSRLLTEFKDWLIWMDSREESRNAPLFIYFHFISPHSLYDPPGAYAERFTDKTYAGVVLKRGPERIWEKDDSYQTEVSEAARVHMVGLYDGEIAFIDDILHDIWKAWGQRKNRNETLLAITSDHGEEFHEHGGWDHGHSLFQELLRVPLIIHFPGRVPSGRRVDTWVSGVDIAPTLLSLAGLEAIEDHMGEDLSQLIFSDSSSHKRSSNVFAELFIDRGVPLDPRPPPEHYSQGYALYADDFKMIMKETACGTELEVYNLAEDPSEEVNLSLEREYAETLRAMEELMAESKMLAASPRFEEARIRIDRRTRENLRALGYVQ